MEYFRSFASPAGDGGSSTRPFSLSPVHHYGAILGSGAKDSVPTSTRPLEERRNRSLATQTLTCTHLKVCAKCKRCCNPTGIGAPNSSCSWCLALAVWVKLSPPTSRLELRRRRRGGAFGENFIAPRGQVMQRTAAECSRQAVAFASATAALFLQT